MTYALFKVHFTVVNFYLLGLLFTEYSIHFNNRKLEIGIVIEPSAKEVINTKAII
jgi:hypothetical protein